MSRNTLSEPQPDSASYPINTEVNNLIKQKKKMTLRPIKYR